MAPRRRNLTPEEQSLWDEVARTTRPLRPLSAKPAKRTAIAQPKQPAGASVVPTKQAVKPRQRHQQTPIDRRTTRRIARGTIAIDRRIDLHGSTQSEAHHRLIHFLAAAQAEGARLVLVITGKGNVSDGERGVLRRVVPHWLTSGPLRSVVGGYEPAHRNHGGSGALYVRLRRGDRGS